MHKRTTRALHFVHKWAGLIAGINILILSLTGTWLVFAEELEDAFPAGRGEPLAVVDLKGASPLQDAFAALAPRHPQGAPASVVWPEHEEDALDLYFKEGMDYPGYRLDMLTGSIYHLTEGAMQKVNHFILHLHADLFLGMMGTIFLGFVGILFLLSTLTGMVIYAPFMKAAFFGAFSPRKGWRRGAADLHKWIGATSLGFNLVIALTGIALTLGFMGVRMWVFQEVTRYAQGEHPILAEGAVPPPVDRAVEAARKAMPELPLTSISFPGELQGPHHFMGFHADRDSFTRFIPSVTIMPAADIEAGEALPIPLWVKAMLISVPFHFGNFAGVGVKLAWCFFGLSAGALSISGTVLTVLRWVKKWRMRRGRRSLAPRGQSLQPMEQEG